MNFLECNQYAGNHSGEEALWFRSGTSDVIVKTFSGALWQGGSPNREVLRRLAGNFQSP